MRNADTPTGDVGTRKAARKPLSGIGMNMRYFGQARMLPIARSAMTIAAAAVLTTSAAHADGYAVPGQIGFQEAVTPIAREMHFFHNVILMPIITAITLFVAALLLWVIFRFNEKANPVPSRTTHHTVLEIAWTILPVLILFVIAIPSMKLLTNELVVPKSDMTLKVTGKQWFWSYEYPKDQNGGFAFDSYLLKGDDVKADDIRQLSVDNQAVVPVNKVIHVLVTGADVIHSFTVPSFGVRIDAVPGRMNETWFKAEKEGTYYGQCSKLCGKDHAFMPIAFKVVSEEAYTAWLNDAKKKFASNDTKPVRLAGAE
jgi:cytochrome c oxidase subunit 2